MFFSARVAGMPTAEIRAAREAYENAINAFSEESGIMYRHQMDGTEPSPTEIERYAQAERILEFVRKSYIAIWRYTR